MLGFETSPPCNFCTFLLLKKLHLIVVLWGGDDDETAVFILHVVDSAGNHVFFEAYLLGECEHFVFRQLVSQPVGMHTFRECDGHTLVDTMDRAVRLSRE